MQKIKFYSLLGVFFLFLHFPSFSQAVNISQLSDQQLFQYMGMSTASGMSDDELVAKAKAKGLTDDQIQQLRTRIQGLNGGAKTAKAATADLSEDRTTVPVKKPGMAKQKTEGLPGFGSELFSNENLHKQIELHSFVMYKRYVFLPLLDELSRNLVQNLDVES